jgi:hypothetical protein
LSRFYSLQQRNGFGTLLLVSLLDRSFLIISYAISVYGYNTGFLILSGIIGFAFLITCFASLPLVFTSVLHSGL